MLPDLTLPVSLMALLARFRPVFTAPSFRTFCALAAGFLAQTGRRTVCGMLTGAGLAGAWPHQRAHRFFSAARWSSERLGLVLAKLIVAALVPEGGPVLVAIDDTLFRRAGKKVHAIGWFHDGSVKGPHQVRLGNNWVIAAIVARLPFMTRPVALPVLARLVVAVEDAKQVFGAGQARNRLATAVHRNIPFTLARQSIAILWYATAGHHPADVDEHRARAPWYTTKAEPSTADMIAKLRRVLIAARYRPVHPAEPTPAEIHT